MPLPVSDFRPAVRAGWGMAAPGESSVGSSTFHRSKGAFAGLPGSSLAQAGPGTAPQLALVAEDSLRISFVKICILVIICACLLRRQPNE